MRDRSLLVIAVLMAACDSNSGSTVTDADIKAGAGGGAGSGGATSTGGTTSSGGTLATGGTASMGGATSAGGATSTGGATSLGGATSSGGSTGAGGVTGAGGTRTDAGADVMVRPDGAFGGSGGTGTGGGGGTGGTPADAGLDVGADAKPDVQGDTAWDVGKDATPTSDATTSDGAPCPYNGHVTYTLAQNANPTAAERQAYTLITAAMDEAAYYYNCYTNITKKLNISYVADASVVPTADGNVNGSIRFGPDTQYMVYFTAMHEVAHTVGIGQYASSNWLSFVNIPSGGSNGPWTGANATAELRAITGNPTDTLTADHDHFWPYGLNKSSDGHTEPDLIAHCRMVMALRKDLGL